MTEATLQGDGSCQIAEAVSTVRPLDPAGCTDDAIEKELILHRRHLAAYARRLAGADADDLLQDTCLRCWSSRASFTAGTSFGAWAATIMRNSFLGARRRDRFRGELPAYEFERRLAADASQYLHLDLLEAALGFSHLDADDREVVLQAVNQVSIVQGAAAVGLSKAAYQGRLRRARQRLRTASAGLSDVRRYDAKARAADKTGSFMKRKAARDWSEVMIG